jgi:hypothetical protein
MLSGCKEMRCAKSLHGRTFQYHPGRRPAQSQESAVVRAELRFAQAKACARNEQTSFLADDNSEADDTHSNSRDAPWTR